MFKDERIQEIKAELFKEVQTETIKEMKDYLLTQLDLRESFLTTNIKYNDLGDAVIITQQTIDEINFSRKLLNDYKVVK